MYAYGPNNLQIISLVKLCLYVVKARKDEVAKTLRRNKKSLKLDMMGGEFHGCGLIADALPKLLCKSFSLVLTLSYLFVCFFFFMDSEFV